jgi:DNA-binding NarL/FixJ family response regulator
MSTHANQTATRIGSASNPAAEAAKTSLTLEAMRTEPHTIWLVEDHADFRETVCRVINRVAGLKCTSQFANAEDALDALRDGGVPDVILLDVELPGQSGLEAVKVIHAISPATRVVMLTVFPDDDKVLRAICGGASGYLLKTAPSSSIVQSIREALGGGAPMTPKIARSVLDMFAHFAGPKETADYGLTAREKEVIQLMTEGLVIKEIADRLQLSYGTVDAHLKNIYTKLHVHTRGGAISKVLKERLI